MIRAHSERLMSLRHCMRWIHTQLPSGERKASFSPYRNRRHSTPAQCLSSLCCLVAFFCEPRPTGATFSSEARLQRPHQIDSLGFGLLSDSDISTSNEWVSLLLIYSSTRRFRSKRKRILPKPCAARRAHTRDRRRWHRAIRLEA